MKSTVGLGLRHPFHSYVLEHKPAVPFFEVITENYLYFDGSPRRFLRQISKNYPLAFHGVSLSIGSLEPIRIDYLTQLKNMIEEFQPLWVSDHLCWTYNGTENSHDLLPISFSKESLKRIISKTQQVQEFLGRKIYLENPSAYVDFKANDYSEEEFINELCGHTGCGLLLDLNNLVVNQYNLGYNPINYLNTIQKCDVKQIHLAGHTIKEKVRIDTHDSDISQEVLDLLPLTKQLWPEANPMVEWDDKIPPIDYLLNLRENIESKWNEVVFTEVIPFAASNSADIAVNNYVASEILVPDKEKFKSFWKIFKTDGYVNESEVQKENMLNPELPTPAHVGMNVYSSAYYNRLLEVLGKIFPVLKIMLDEVFNDVMLAYLERCPSTQDSIDFIGNKLAEFIEEHEFNYSLGVDKLIVSDIAKFENSKNLSLVAFADRHQTLNAKSLTETDWINKKLKLKSEVVVQRFNSEIHRAIESIQLGETPEVPVLKTTGYVFYRQGNEFILRQISDNEFIFFKLFSSFKVFADAINTQPPDQVQIFAELLLKYEKLFCME